MTTKPVTDAEIDAALEGMHFTASGLPRREDVRRALEQFAQSHVVEAVGAVPVEWDGKLNDTLQRALNALYLECAPEVVNGLTHTVRESFRAVCTDRATLQHMLKGALAKLPIEEGGTAPPSSKTQDDLAGGDPMDWPLPCDVTVGHGTMRKGVALRSLVARMKTLYAMATGRNADEWANLSIDERKAMFEGSALNLENYKVGGRFSPMLTPAAQSIADQLASQPKAPAPVSVVQGERRWTEYTPAGHPISVVDGGALDSPDMAVGAVGGVGAKCQGTLTECPTCKNQLNKCVLFATPAPEQATTGSGQDSGSVHLGSGDRGEVHAPGYSIRGANSGTVYGEAATEKDLEVWFANHPDAYEVSRLEFKGSPTIVVIEREAQS